MTDTEVLEKIMKLCDDHKENMKRIGEEREALKAASSRGSEISGWALWGEVDRSTSKMNDADFDEWIQSLRVNREMRKKARHA